MENLFKITYLLSGKYKSTYKAKIMLWKNQIVNIRDENGKEYNLKEEYILSVRTIRQHKLSQTDNTNIESEQKSLFG